MMRVADLISPEYRELQRELHGRPKGYGGKGKKWADAVVHLAKRYGAGSVLDYGCGQGSLMLEMSGRNTGLRLADYDPAIPGRDGQPSFADLVVSTDVLEHIEPDRLDAVLAHIRSLARKAVFFVVALDEANKVLTDGRNAHLILKEPEWWASRIVNAGFRLDSLENVPLPVAYGDPAKRSKRWIAVGVPC